MHLLHCKSTSVEDHKAAQVHSTTKLTKSFMCKECGTGCSTKGALKVHMTSHDTFWIPKGCDVIGCASKTVFKNESGGKAHQTDRHNSFVPLPCPVRGCTVGAENKLFQSRSSFKQHLGTHGMKGKEVTDYLPKRVSEGEWVPIECMFPDCRRGGLLDTRRNYRQHLYDWHELRKGQTAQYMPF